MKHLIALFGLLLCFSSQAQERRLALVIGNGDYSNDQLANPENDAKSMELALEDIGFEVYKYENLNRVELAKAIDQFGNKLSEYDVGLFFYAGHGIQSKGFNYLVPVDASLKTESDIEFNCVRADRVLGKMDDAKNGVNIVILDACRNNPFERSWTRSTNGRGLATMNGPMGSIIGYATSPGKIASDGAGENGTYTEGLLKFLNEPGITAIQMFQKVTAFVLRNSNGEQLPWVSTSLTADFFMVPGTAVTTLPLDKDEVEIRKSITKNAEDSSEEGVSLAVLPFANLTGNKEMNYLVNGQHDALYTELCKLSQIQPIRVVGSRSAKVLSNSELSVPELAESINVQYLIEGSVQSFNDSVFMQIRLIKAFPEEKPIYAATYSSDFRNILKLHSNIAGQISKKVNMEISPENFALLPKARSVNPEAYKAYLRGMYSLSKSTPESIKQGLEYLHSAVDLDPAEPFALSGLALGYIDIAHGPLDEGDALDKAEACILKAARIDSSFAEIYASLGSLYYYKKMEFEKAEKYYQKALKLNPNTAIVHYHYSWLLYCMGRMDEAIVEHKLAQKYDPFNPQHTAWLAALYCYDGRYSDALRTCKESQEIQEDFFAGYYALGITYLELGRVDEAIEAHKTLREKYPIMSFPLARTYALSGQRKKAEKILKEMEEMQDMPFKAFSLVSMNSALGNMDEAFKWVEYEPHHTWAVAYVVMPEFENLRKDPRIHDFVKKWNLPYLKE